jgi:phenylalanyl-tRNA synthetase alpha chain
LLIFITFTGSRTWIMEEKIRQLLEEAKRFEAESPEAVEAFRIQYLGKKGHLNALFADFKTVPAEQKKEIGQHINTLKQYVTEKVDVLKAGLAASAGRASIPDMTVPGKSMPLGARHPISIVRNQVIDIFTRLGYNISEGPEIEDDWHVFSALNFPPEHPARDMQDTFFIEKDPDVLLRTHTSSVQVRVMENTQPPIRTISPGRVFRNEAISARAHCIFHQVEGLYIDKNVSFADLKQTLMYFAKEMFGSETETRFRPSFFPFTEPSAEMDISCKICGGKGCNVCKYTGWLEILGCGMVDPNVLEHSGIDSRSYTGFAFGMGIERIAMLRYEVKDLRLYFENDARFLEQFSAAF